MKRSQMVEILREAIINNADSEKNPEFCSKVLLELEEAGMLPPSTILQPLNVRDNAWDPE